MLWYGSAGVLDIAICACAVGADEDAEGATGPAEQEALLVLRVIRIRDDEILGVLEDRARSTITRSGAMRRCVLS